MLNALLYIPCIYPQFAGIKKRLDEMTKMVKDMGDVGKGFKVETARKKLNETIQATNAQYQDIIAELETIFAPSEDFEDFEDVASSVELTRADPQIEDVLADFEKMKLAQNAVQNAEQK
jgi:hypothetical protein